jgi:hypothetical protein
MSNRWKCLKDGCPRHNLNEFEHCLCGAKRTPVPTRWKCPNNGCPRHNLNEFDHCLCGAKRTPMPTWICTCSQTNFEIHVDHACENCGCELGKLCNLCSAPYPQTTGVEPLTDDEDDHDFDEVLRAMKLVTSFLNKNAGTHLAHDVLISNYFPEALARHHKALNDGPM